MPRALLRLLGCLVAGICMTSALAGAVSDYLIKDGKLRAVLKISETQGGVVGFTGTVWVIEPSGDWRVAPVRNAQEGRPLRKGRLTDRQLTALAQHLATQDLLRLPDRLGPDTGANPPSLQHQLREENGHL